MQTASVATISAPTTSGDQTRASGHVFSSESPTPIAHPTEDRASEDAVDPDDERQHDSGRGVAPVEQSNKTVSTILAPILTGLLLLMGTWLWSTSNETTRNSARLEDISRRVQELRQLIISALDPRPEEVLRAEGETGEEQTRAARDSTKAIE